MASIKPDVEHEKNRLCLGRFRAGFLSSDSRPVRAHDRVENQSFDNNVAELEHKFDLVGWLRAGSEGGLRINTDCRLPKDYEPFMLGQSGR